METCQTVTGEPFSGSGHGPQFKIPLQSAWRLGKMPIVRSNGGFQKHANHLPTLRP